MLAVVFPTLMLSLMTGCEEDPYLVTVAGHDFGAMDPARCAALGDSITIGYGDAGVPWPARLASQLGCRIDNYGVGGMTSAGGVDMIDGVLRSGPGFVLIQYGANDAIHGRSTDALRANLDVMVSKIRASHAIPLVANVSPMTDGHSLFAGAARAMNRAIADFCDSEGVVMVDVASEFGSGDGLLQPDGLHPNASGQQTIADLFYRHLRHAFP